MTCFVLRDSNTQLWLLDPSVCECKRRTWTETSMKNQWPLPIHHYKILRYWNLKLFRRWRFEPRQWESLRPEAEHLTEWATKAPHTKQTLPQVELWWGMRASSWYNAKWIVAQAEILQRTFQPQITKIYLQSNSLSRLCWHCVLIIFLLNLLHCTGTVLLQIAMGNVFKTCSGLVQVL